MRGGQTVGEVEIRVSPQIESRQDSRLVNVLKTRIDEEWPKRGRDGDPWNPITPWRNEYVDDVGNDRLAGREIYLSEPGSLEERLASRGFLRIIPGEQANEDVGVDESAH